MSSSGKLSASRRGRGSVQNPQKRRTLADNAPEKEIRPRSEGSGSGSMLRRGAAGFAQMPPE